MFTLGQAVGQPTPTDPLKDLKDPKGPAVPAMIPKGVLPNGTMPPPATGTGTTSPSMSTDQPQWPKEILGKKLDVWTRDIRDPDPSVRENAIRTVGLFGPTAKKMAARNLIASLDDDDASCRLNAIMAVSSIGFEDVTDVRVAVNSLTRLLRYSQSIVRYHACMALGNLGPDAAPAIGDLCTYSMRDTSTWEIRRAAAFALGRIAIPDKDQPADRRAHIALANALTDPSGIVRREAMQSLLMLGRPGLPADLQVLRDRILQHAVKDKDRSVAIWARVCLMRLDPGAPNPTNITALSNLLKHKDPVVVLQATQAIGVIGPTAKQAIPDLIELLGNEEPACVTTACWALSLMGADANDAIVKLTALTKSKDEIISKAAQEAIDYITGKKKYEVPKAAKAAAVNKK